MGALVQRLLETRDTGLPDLGPGPAAAIARLSRSLTSSEIDQLAAVVEDGGRVGIEYVSAGGAYTRRVISEPELVGSALYAWCELRQDERVFTLSRILSVALPDEKPRR